jgi:hypothetical protein
MKADQRAFSLVEVAIALASLTFCITALLGLLPAGIASHHNSEGESRAVQIIDTLAAKFWSVKFDSGSNQYRIVSLGEFPPFGIGQAPFSISYGFTEGGDLCAVNDFAGHPDLCGSIYIKVIPPEDGNPTGSAYISVAWPGAANFVNTGWKNCSGQVQAAVFFTLQE